MTITLRAYDENGSLIAETIAKTIRRAKSRFSDKLQARNIGKHYYGRVRYSSKKVTDIWGDKLYVENEFERDTLEELMEAVDIFANASEVKFALKYWNHELRR